MMSDSSPTQIIDYEVSRIVKMVELHVSKKKINKRYVVVELTPINSRGLRYESKPQAYIYDII